MWVYTTSFILGYSALVWTFSWKSGSGQWAPGLVLGCFLALLFMLISTITMQKLQLYRKQEDQEEMDLSDILIKPELHAPDAKTVHRLRRFQKVLSAAGLIFVLITIIPMLAATSLAEQESAASVAVAILVLLTVVFGVILTDVKWRLRQFGPALGAFCLACCWAMVILPLVCLVPTTLAVTSSNQDLQMISSWTIGFSCILCMLGVSSLSILLNYVYKRLEYEKLAKYCCRKMQRLLKENGVWSRMPLLRQAFDHFYFSEESIFESVLLEATYITHKELTSQDKPFSCSKQLLTVAELMKLVAGVQEEPDREEKRGKERRCARWILRLCSNVEQEEVPLEVDQLLPAELGGSGEIPEDNAEIQYEERALVQQLAISSSFNPARYREMFQEEEVVVAQAEAKVQAVDMLKYMGGLVQRSVQTMRKQQKVMGVKELVERNREMIIGKLMELEEGEPVVANEDLHVSKVNKHDRKRLLQSQHFQSLKLDRNKRKEWFRLVYKRFAHGEPGRDLEMWSLLHDLRQFVRIVSCT